MSEVDRMVDKWRRQQEEERRQREVGQSNRGVFADVQSSESEADIRRKFECRRQEMVFGYWQEWERRFPDAAASLYSDLLATGWDRCSTADKVKIYGTLSDKFPEAAVAAEVIDGTIKSFGTAGNEQSREARDYLEREFLKQSPEKRRKHGTRLYIDSYAGFCAVRARQEAAQQQKMNTQQRQLELAEARARARAKRRDHWLSKGGWRAALARRI